MPVYANAEQAFLGELAHLEARGIEVSVRGSTTREALGRSFAIEHPLERCITVPSRLNNITAAIVESMWVLTGRNDISALSPYLPRAKDFSDDGTTWRAGYGPRLRDWYGVDQVDSVRRLLVADPTSRRGVISLFDPAVDHVSSLDVPCNNWLHFVRRAKALDLFIAVRSNDIIWGFSGINSFEWSVLHELMASWLGVDVGRQHWFVSSMHIYDRHFERSKAILGAAAQSDPRSYAPLSARYQGQFSQLDADLANWFRLESAIRTGDSSGSGLASQVADPLFRAFLDVVDAFWASKRHDDEGVEAALARLGRTDLGLATTEYVSRTGNTSAARTEPSQPPPQETSIPPVDTTARRTRSALKALHAQKSAAYGDSWKRRGELLGILANVARKVDRLANRAAWATDDGESRVDTLSDLLIYLVKYQTFLADRDAGVFANLFDGAVAAPASEGNDGVDFLLEAVQPALPPPPDAFDQIEATFEPLLDMAAQAPERFGDRSEVVARLSELTFGLLISEPGD